MYPLTFYNFCSWTISFSKILSSKLISESKSWLVVKTHVWVKIKEKKQEHSIAIDRPFYPVVKLAMPWPSCRKNPPSKLMPTCCTLGLYLAILLHSVDRQFNLPGAVSCNLLQHHFNTTVMGECVQFMKDLFYQRIVTTVRHSFKIAEQLSRKLIPNKRYRLLLPI